MSRDHQLIQNIGVFIGTELVEETKRVVDIIIFKYLNWI